MKEVDARGLSCPQPVLLTRRAMQEGQPVVTLVDNETARDNVARMARAAGWGVSIEQRGAGYAIHLTPPPSGQEPLPTASEQRPARLQGQRVLLLAADSIGQGDEELGRILMRSFLHTLLELEPKPDLIICANAGVKLVVQGSPVLEELRSLAERGVEILACGTCLDYFGLKDKVAVGTVSNMYTIAERLLAADIVVRL